MSQHHRPKSLEPLVRFWWSDASLTFLLVMLFLVLFVIMPLRTVGVLGAFLIEVFFSLIVVSGVFAVATSPLIGALAATLALATLALHWTRLATLSDTLAILDALSSLSMFAMLAAVVLMQVFREGPITIARIQGAICAYILIGLMFAITYRLVTFYAPDAFSISVGAQHSLPDSPSTSLTGELVYFSFVTLTTLGYGDITAVHPVARSLAILEALVGQLFPAILIARLVSLEIHYRQIRRDAREGSSDDH